MSKIGCVLRAGDEASMRNKLKTEKYSSLYVIDVCLTNEIYKEKFGQVLFESANVGIRKIGEKIKGSFLFGSRKGNPWEWYGDVDKGIEDGE